MRHQRRAPSRTCAPSWSLAHGGTHGRASARRGIDDAFVHGLGGHNDRTLFLEYKVGALPIVTPVGYIDILRAVQDMLEEG